MREIIAFVGRAGSGKDYQSNLLVTEKGFKRIAFADSMREILRKTLGMKEERFHQKYEEYKKSYIFENQTLRNMLEDMGSAIRYYDSNFFVNALLHEIFSGRLENDNVCISDLRYINEFKSIYSEAQVVGDSFKCIFCNYKSDRYQEHNDHPSAYLSNTLVKLGYKDLQEVDLKTIEEIESWNLP